jgi:hypothetical protein
MDDGHLFNAARDHLKSGIHGTAPNTDLRHRRTLMEACFGAYDAFEIFHPCWGGRELARQYSKFVPQHLGVQPKLTQQLGLIR